MSISVWIIMFYKYLTMHLKHVCRKILHAYTQNVAMALGQNTHTYAHAQTHIHTHTKSLHTQYSPRADVLTHSSTHRLCSVSTSLAALVL